MSPPIAVEVLENGPLKLSGVPSLRCFGEDRAVEGDVYLCRCGDSSKAPFCDGTHKKIGFEGGGPAPAPSEVKVWEGQSVRTFFDPAVCMHVFYCKPLKGLREQEEQGDAAAAKEILRVVATCPSGALRAEVKGPVVMPDPPRPAAAVEIMAGGEVRIQATFEARNFALRGDQPDDRATLCRCGKSASKPFCDGRHKQRRDWR